jgi:hypothetical protein
MPLPEPPPVPVASQVGDCAGLDYTKFDALIARHGMAVKYRHGQRCACYRYQSGVPDPGCTLCFAIGIVWDAPLDILVFGPNRKPTRRIDMIGQYEVGDVFFTFQTGFEPADGARITVPNTALLTDDILTRGKEDRVIYPTAHNLSSAWYVVRTPPTGDPYENVRVNLTPGVDIFMDENTKRVTYADPNIPPVGTRVLVQVETLTEYIVSEVQDRYGSGTLQPYRALCKRYTSWLHPRAKEAVAY